MRVRIQLGARITTAAAYAALAAAIACTSRESSGVAAGAVEREAARPTAPPASVPAPSPAAVAPGALPPLGLAIPDSADRWCGTLAHDALAPGARVTLVLPQPGVTPPSYAARVRAARSTPCRTAFGAVVLGDSDRAYDLEIVGAAAAQPDGALTAALLVADTTRWQRAADGVARADLDGDGVAEEARSCLADEGRYFVVRNAASAGAEARPRWWAYFDLGAMVDPTCAPGERPVGDSAT
ncbi:MAG TPA: hypothetical protein VFS08_08830 [Gemmatimonadaceae bacterium]|nr:hypothetical protein [Gemmatimonadaceae bacterium]